MNRYPEHY